MMKRFATEGMIAGTIGATVMAAWFLVYDLAHGQPFRTPALLGAVLFQGLRDLGSLRITGSLVLEYSLVHWAAFMLFGCTAAALLAAADQDPRLLAGLLVFFCCFEVMALALIALLGEWLFEALPQWSIVIGNLLSAVAMLSVFFRRHRVAWLEFILADE
ncbi:MAG: hypothetical protein C5B48_06585 [Candidatus Rokuibacteriota bacterium]|nr:MAG: hypothetical protein C5B48_06585 [Candidatus Rokubacteria bacterium]